MVRGQGDQWDKKSRFRGITASFSLNGVGLVAEETTDLYQENEELKVSLFFSHGLSYSTYVKFSGGNTETCSSNRVYENCQYGSEQ